MLGDETRERVMKARERTEIQISVRWIEDESGQGRPDPRAATVREQAWEDMKAKVADAVRAFEGDGLRILRPVEKRKQLILIGPAAAWRRFLDDRRVLVGDQSVEFKHYVRPWHDGLPGFP